MTTETTVGREPIQIIEIDQPFCNLTYGSAPCTAALGVTGERKCYNTRATCQDLDNIDLGTQTLKFVKPRSNAPKDEYLIPSLVGVRTSPTVINAGGGGKNKGPLGVRATMSATFADHPHSDLLVDKYLADRSFNPLERGTFWGKWLARNPFYQNKQIRVLDGYVGQSLASMQSRTYLIESVNGPDSSGRVSIVSKDILTLADNDKAQAPAGSFGELIVDINDTITTIRITGAAASEYPAPGLVRINDEVISYSGVSTIDPTEINLTGCFRAQENTTADSHSSEDRVQFCIQYTAEPVVDVVYDLLVNYAGIDASFIPKTDWDTEGNKWLSQFNVSVTLTEPLGVNKLLAELTEQALFYIWWDERDQEIKLQAVRPITAEKQINDSNGIIADSVSVKPQPKDRITQAWVFWDIKDPTQDVQKDASYSKLRISADLDLETADAYGESKIRKVYARWINSEAQAINLASRLLSRYKQTPRMMVLALDAKDRALWTGDVAEVEHRGVVDDTGAIIPQNWQVISADEADSGHLIRYTLQDFEYLDERVAFWMENAAPVFTLATDDQKAFGMWWSDTNGEMSDGSDGYRWQ